MVLFPRARTDFGSAPFLVSLVSGDSCLREVLARIHQCLRLAHDASKPEQMLRPHFRRPLPPSLSAAKVEHTATPRFTICGSTRRVHLIAALPARSCSTCRLMYTSFCLLNTSATVRCTRSVPGSGGARSNVRIAANDRSWLCAAAGTVFVGSCAHVEFDRAKITANSVNVGYVAVFLLQAHSPRFSDVACQMRLQIVSARRGLARGRRKAGAAT
jgi:hypothetical protein